MRSSRLTWRAASISSSNSCASRACPSSFAGSPEAPEPAVEYVSSEQVAEIVRTGSSAQVDSELASLRASLSSADLIQLAGEVLQILHVSSSPADIGSRLRDIVATLAPTALSVPPAAAVQVARGYGVVRGKQDGRWFLDFVRALQAGSGPEPATSDGVAVPPS